MAWKMKVLCTAIWVRNGPGTSYKKVSTVSNGEIITFTEEAGYKNYWNKCDKGWICSRDADGTIVMAVVKDTPAEQPKPVEPKPEPSGNTAEDPDAPKLVEYEQYMLYEGPKGGNNNYTIRNLFAIHGLPYQFMPSVDARILPDAGDEDATLGRKYAEKIIARIPMLLITPGKPKFMNHFSDKERKNVLEKMLSSAGSNMGLDSLLQRQGRYYTFEFDYVSYYNYVNSALRICASFLGVGKETLKGTRLDLLDWTKISTGGLNPFLDVSDYGAVAFYINSDTQITENFSNSTTESSLANSVNSLSEKAREIRFLLGYSANATGVGEKVDSLLESDLNQNIENVQQTIKSITHSNFLEALAGHVSTISAGGRLIFPEIWSDSSFDRSFDINIKLTSPDNDMLSWYFNICVPLIHLICLAAPKSVDANPNGYISPFLVRGFYKGLFNVDMGIITSMSITRGAESAWTKEGLPTEVDVSFTLKDLYQTMSITSMQDLKYDTLNNTALMDYLANMCGININKPEVMRQIDMWFTMNFVARVRDAVLKNIWGGIDQRYQNVVMGIYRSKWFP